MKKVICILILTAGAAGTAMAQAAPNNEYTWGHRNGRYWNGSTFAVKLGIVIGMSEGVRWLYSEFDKYVGPGTFGEGIKALDAFYSEPANLNFPILAAQEVVTTKQKGAMTTQEMEAFLSVMRPNFVPGTMTVPNEPDESVESNKPVLPQRLKI